MFLIERAPTAAGVARSRDRLLICLCEGLGCARIARKIRFLLPKEHAQIRHLTVYMLLY
jgi:hypothetical protein